MEGRQYAFACAQQCRLQQRKALHLQALRRPAWHVQGPDVLSIADYLVLMLWFSGGLTGAANQSAPFPQLLTLFASSNALSGPIPAQLQQMSMFNPAFLANTTRTFDLGFNDLNGRQALLLEVIEAFLPAQLGSMAHQPDMQFAASEAGRNSGRPITNLWNGFRIQGLDQASADGSHSVMQCALVP